MWLLSYLDSIGEVTFWVLTALFAVAIVRSVRKALKEPPPLPPTPHEVKIRKDGFWLKTTAHEPGTVLQITYRVPGRKAKTVSIRYQPTAEGHFVETGGRVTALSVVGGD